VRQVSDPDRRRNYRIPPDHHGGQRTLFYVQTGNKTEGAMTLVLKLLSLTMTWYHGQARVLSLQCLNTGSFVYTDNNSVLGGCKVQFNNFFCFGKKVRVGTC
jgi:hypothetical protein